MGSPQSGAFISAGANGLNPIYNDKGAYVNKVKLKNWIIYTSKNCFSLSER